MGILADLIALVNGNTEKTLDVLIQEKATETNSKIDNRASQESIVSLDTKVQTGNNLIGATNNTGGTASAGSIFAKLNKLLTDWTTARAGYLDTINTNVGTLLNGRVVKSVQRGVATFVGLATQVSISITSINSGKSMVLINGQILVGGDETTEPILKELRDNQITLMIYSGATRSIQVSWQVIEFY